MGKVVASGAAEPETVGDTPAEVASVGMGIASSGTLVASLSTVELAELAGPLLVTGALLVAAAEDAEA
jgi:hypothetical protein